MLDQITAIETAKISLNREKPLKNYLFNGKKLLYYKIKPFNSLFHI
jgi:hypothetical protein